MQNICFKDTEQLDNIISNPFIKRTTLTEWLRNNQFDNKGHHLRYIDYLSAYRWDTRGRCWIRRATSRTPTIGRLVYVYPSCGETFYLLMMLAHQRGCQSFTDIRTVSGETCPTYRNACEALGLLGDDKEWSYTIDEYATWATSSELRSLFTHMLLYCEISNPMQLWNEQWHRMADDAIQKYGFMNDEDLKQYVLYEVELLLCSGATPSSLSEFGLPMPRVDLLSYLRNKLLMEEKNYDRQRLAIDHESFRRCLHPQQIAVYELVIRPLASNKQVLLFVYGHGGTGKTFLWTTIISALRSEDRIVLAVAAAGIV